MGGNLRNGGKVTHDPGERISWTNRPPVSKLLDTDAKHRIVSEVDPAKRKELITDSWEQKRGRMKEVCGHPLARLRHRVLRPVRRAGDSV